MDSKASTTRPLTSAKTETAVIPRIPREIIDGILDYLATDSYSAVTFLRSCSLVSKSWVPPCRRHLFRFVTFDLRNVDRWLEAFPRPEESPAHHIRELCVRFGGRDCIPEGFFEVTPLFKNVEKLTLMGLRGLPLRVPSLWKLPPSVTSLTIKTNAFTLVEVRDLLALLPDLNGLSLTGYLAAGGVPVGIGTVLRGRFGGRLRILKGPAHEGITKMLLEIPTGLRFTEMEIRCKCKFLLSTVKLAEACGETLVKLLYAVSVYDGAEASERSFDFSKLPILQEVGFEVGWTAGSLPWLPTALSTLRPATSPRMSAIRLNLVSHSATDQSIELLLKNAGSDLRRVADEFARIEREFEGAVNLTVSRNGGFQAVFDRLDILHRYAC